MTAKLQQIPREVASQHEGQLSWVVEFESRDTFTAGKHRGLGQVMELASIDETLQDILLNVKIVVADG